MAFDNTVGFLVTAQALKSQFAHWGVFLQCNTNMRYIKIWAF